MPLKRTFDATFLNTVANHADVRPWLLGFGELDLTPVLSAPQNVALVGPDGGFVFSAVGNGDYDVHTLFLPGAVDPFAAAVEAAGYMFIRTDCVRITTKVPHANIPAARLAAAMGFRQVFQSALMDCACLELTIDAWALANAALGDVGEAFHTAEDEATRGADALPVDTVHDRMVGALVRMATAGNTLKGVGFYNRWAAHAGYPPVRALTLEPPILDMGSSAVTFLDGAWEILTCR